MKEIDKPADDRKSFEREVKSALKEVAVIFAEGGEVYEEHSTPLDGDTIDTLRKYLHDGFLEHYRLLLDKDPYHPDAQRVLHEENAYMTVDRKLEQLQQEQEPRTIYHLGLTNREAEMLGYAIGTEHYRQIEANNFDLQPWDKDKYVEEARQVVTFFENFRNAGGQPNHEHVDYFQRLLIGV